MQQHKYIYTHKYSNLLLIANDKSILKIEFINQEIPKIKPSVNEIMKMAIQQLDEYFSGNRTTFDIPIAFDGTDFQNKVWNALYRIPYGETRSYQDIAIAIGNPKASRAIGNANHENPIPIIIPCHRVIRANGDLGGFGGGLDTKTYLLKLEQDNKIT